MAISLFRRECSAIGDLYAACVKLNLRPCAADDLLLFLKIKVAHHDLDSSQPRFSPGEEIDKIWHHCILNTALYDKLCTFAGARVHHSTATEDDAEKLKVVRMARTYFEMRRMYNHESTFLAEDLGPFCETIDFNCPIDKVSFPFLVPYSDAGGYEQTISIQDITDVVSLDLTHESLIVHDGDQLHVVSSTTFEGLKGVLLSPTQHSCTLVSKYRPTVTVRLEVHDQVESTTYTLDLEVRDDSSVDVLYLEAAKLSPFQRFEMWHKGRKVGRYDKLPVLDNLDSIILTEKVKRHCPGEKEITLLVRDLTGKVLTLTGIIPSSTSVEELKEMIQDIDGIPPDQQRLIFRGKQLEDDRLIVDYDVRDNDTMYLVIRLRGC
mmetsp:Transcript_10219/g.16743  ORF Transcript_10219/g.16743 Transcript_10219/m.16743 type:complete len:378 (+) Transcript_10219:22-1155(+)